MSPKQRRFVDAIEHNPTFAQKVKEPKLAPMGPVADKRKALVAVLLAKKF